MTWNNVRLIFQREVRDQLRDRRTLFMVAVLPVILYPALGIGLVQMTVSFSEQTRTLLILNADEMPSPSLLDGDRIDARYFGLTEDASRLRVVTGGVDAEADPELQTFFEEAKAKQEALRLAAEASRARSVVPEGDDQPQPPAEALEARRELEAWFRKGPAQVLIWFPPGFQQQFQEFSRRLADGDDLNAASIDSLRPVILCNTADEKSQIAFRRVLEAIRSWEDVLLAQRLEDAELPATLTRPVNLLSVDLANSEELAANVWSKVFPALLVIMSVTGAFYPAIDLGAGEKERGTMETLLICPATRAEIVIGKFLTVMLFSISTALLNLASMGFTGRHVFSMMGAQRSASLGDIAFPGLSALIWIVLLAVPLAALFSALSLAIATFARSSKEGQYYLTPLLMVTMGLTMFCLNPAVELTPYYSVLPVVGPALLLKSLLQGVTPGTILGLYAVPVLATSLSYSLLALWWAIEQFQREDILFREAERFDLMLWFRHLLRDKEPTPSFSEAGFCFVLILLLQFVFLTSMGSAVSSDGSALNLVRLQLIYLLATVGTPAVMMALLLTSDARETLKLYLPSGRLMLIAIVLPVALQPLALELLHRLDWFFPPPPSGAARLLASMGENSVPLWFALAAFSVAPALCEEFAFRGFILSGLQRSRHRWLPIVISSLLFGVIHLIPKQIFNAALLGLVLGLLTVRSGSLLPAIVFHAIFNGLQVVATRVDLAAVGEAGGRALLWVEQTDEGGALRFSTAVLVVSAIVSLVLIRWLVKTLPAQEVPMERRMSGGTISDA